jgi:hypothetical protein
MVLLDAALHLVYELPYRCRYAHRRLARLGLAQIMVPTWGGPCRAFIGQPSLEARRPRVLIEFLSSSRDLPAFGLGDFG